MIKKIKSPKSFFKPKTLIAVFLTPILLLGFLIRPARAQWADHLVISAVQITEGEGKTNHDFIEVYNPTLNDINLKGFRLVKRTKTGASDASIKSWTDDTIVKAHGWRLWASSEDETYSVGIGADDATKQTIAPDNGIAIRLGGSDVGEIIDSVAWGEAENIFKEGNPAAVLGANESLVRKPGTADGGNGEETNNNAVDFSTVINYAPHNSRSVAVPFVENPGFPDLSPTPSPISSPANSDPAAQRSFPVSEAGLDKEAVIGEKLDFDGSDSYDPNGKELIFSWDFGDKTNAKGMDAFHAYNATGEYSVILKVDNGENISEDSLKVKVISPEFSDKIILSEILPNPIGADKDGEWIELYNSGDKEVNLRGWILAINAKTSGKQHVITEDNFIKAKSFLVVKRNESGLVLANDSGSLSLICPPEKIVSEVAYGVAKEGKSYIYINNAWQWSDIPTPGKENLVKASETADAGDKESFKAQIDTSKNSNNQAFFADEDEFADNNTAGTPVVKNSTPQSLKNATFEDYLNKLILKEVNDAISDAKTGGTESQEKTPLPADNSGIGSNAALGGSTEPDCRDICSETNQGIINNKSDVRNNPWFYGDLFLSILSLFLVWRYQEFRKTVKN